MIFSLKWAYHTFIIFYNILARKNYFQSILKPRDLLVTFFLENPSKICLGFYFFLLILEFRSLQVLITQEAQLRNSRERLEETQRWIEPRNAFKKLSEVYERIEILLSKKQNKMEIEELTTLMLCGFYLANPPLRTQNANPTYLKKKPTVLTGDFFSLVMSFCFFVD